MTKELKPCPFCGKIPQANEVFRDRGVWKADVCCWGCGFAIAYFAASRQEAERMAVHKWNTRYKRTCKIGDGLDCSNCGSIFDIGPCDKPRFCMYCGAEVVDD